MGYSTETIQGLDQPAICKNDIVLKDKDVRGVSFKVSVEVVNIHTDCSQTRESVGISTRYNIQPFYRSYVLLPASSNDVARSQWNCKSIQRLPRGLAIVGPN
jgi:hypothetical protein